MLRYNTTYSDSDYSAKHPGFWDRNAKAFTEAVQDVLAMALQSRCDHDDSDGGSGYKLQGRWRR